MTVKVLAEHHLEVLSLGCTGSSESTLVKMPHCWKSYVKAHMRLTVHEFVDLDKNVENSVTISEEGIIESITGKPGDDDKGLKPPSHLQLHSHEMLLKLFFESQSSTTESDMTNSL